MAAISTDLPSLVNSFFDAQGRSDTLAMRSIESRINDYVKAHGVERDYASLLNDLKKAVALLPQKLPTLHEFNQLSEELKRSLEAGDWRQGLQNYQKLSQFVDLFAKTTQHDAALRILGIHCTDLCALLPQKERRAFFASRVTSGSTGAVNLSLLSESPPLGIQNIGNSCYLNSALQLLFNASSTCRAILGRERGVLKPVTEMLKSYCNDQVDGNSVCTETPERVKERFGPNIGINNGDQHDPDLFISKVVGECGQQMVCESRRYSDGVLISENGYVNEQGVLANASPLFEINIQERGHNYLQERVSASFVEQISEEVNGQKKTIVVHSPQDLFLRAKRFVQGRADNGELIERKLRVDINGVEEGFFIETEEEESMVPYQVKGCIIHMGKTVDSGHYVSLVKKEDGNWYLANDEAIFRWNSQRGEWFSLSENRYLERGTLLIEGVSSPSELLRKGYIYHFERGEPTTPRRRCQLAVAVASTLWSVAKWTFNHTILPTIKKLKGT